MLIVIDGVHPSSHAVPYLTELLPRHRVQAVRLSLGVSLCILWHLDIGMMILSVEWIHVKDNISKPRIDTYILRVVRNDVYAIDAPVGTCSVSIYIECFWQLARFGIW